jgi:hypothetical protein
MRVIDRRAFLLGAAGAAWGAVGLGARPWLPWAAAATPATAPRAATPTARRTATLGALVASLRDGPDGRFGAVSVRVAQRRYARWYAAQGEAERARADAVLDALGRRAVPAYTTLARTASSCRSARSAPHAAALAAAVDLAATVCEPPPAEDERPPAPALEPRA